MDLSKRKFGEDLAASLENDLGNFARNLRSKDQTKPTVIQPNILLSEEPPTPSCEAGRNLLEELLNPISSDIVLKVDGETFFCHKEVLSSRCQYFSAMLQNEWRETNSKEVLLNNVKPGAVASLLSFLYGASPEMPQYCPLMDVLQIADMFGVLGLTDVAKCYMKVEMCHSFHKPCKVCIAATSEVLQLACVFSIFDLMDLVLHWNVKYFPKLWPTKGFACLQVDVRRKCVEAVEHSMSSTNAIYLIMETDKLLSSITRVQWTRPVVDMGTKLLATCCDFISANFLDLVENRTILVLFEGMGWKVDIVERILLQIGNSLTIDNICNVHLAVSRLLYLAGSKNWTEEFRYLLNELKQKVWSFLILNYYAVIHTEHWHLVSSADKITIKTQTLCLGDSSRKLSKKPVLSSSLEKKPPTPLVLRRQPMKVKPRKPTKKTRTKPSQQPTTQNGDEQAKISIYEFSTTPPERIPVICEQEFLAGGILNETVVASPLLSTLSDT